MNEHPDQRYIYIAPFLDRDGRVYRECPDLHFIEPDRHPVKIQLVSDGNDEVEEDYKRCTKYEDFIRLLRMGANISSTHQLFTRYTDEACELIREGGYTLIIDECLDTFHMEAISSGDLDIMMSAGTIEVAGDTIVATPGGGERLYQSKALREYGLRLQNHTLHILRRTKDKDARPTSYGLWSLNRRALEAFKNVYILTYLFETQDMYYYFQLENIPYEYIGIEQDDVGLHFSETGSFVPTYTSHITDKIHILLDDKLNEIGDAPNALNVSWYADRSRFDPTALNKNLRTFGERRGAPVGPAPQKDGVVGDTRRMVTTYKRWKSKITQKGWKQTWVPYTQKGINSMRNRDVLAFLVNLYQNGTKMAYFARNGVTYDQDGFALSNMIQWVWRSAIRDGDEIWLYVPSARMRTLFTEWMKDVESGCKIQGINERIPI